MASSANSSPRLARIALVVILVLLCCFHFYVSVEATIVATSRVKECTNHGATEPELLNKTGEPCEKKLIVTLTVSGNEGKAQHLKAKIVRVTDTSSTQPKNLQLKHPVRIRINKSPVLINYRLYEVGYVNHHPHEIVVGSRGCRDDWFCLSHQAPCGFVLDEDGNRVFDSQGFCCGCRMGGRYYDRGEGVGCTGRDTAHCLRFDPLNYYVFGFYPPQLQFNITVHIEQLTYQRRGGTDVWEPVSTLEIGPHRRIAKSENFKLKAEYIADFYPSNFMDATKLAHRYLLVPDRDHFTRPETPDARNRKDWDSVHNMSEWMAPPKHYFDFTGLSCNKIGVHYSAFRNQGTRCSTLIGSCLQNQPRHLWESDKDLEREGRRGRHLIHNFGRVHSLPHSPHQTNYQLNFIANIRRNSVIQVSMVADDLKTVVNRSPGRIVEAYIDSFEALSTDGLLTVIVQNTGSITATYRVFVVHCSAGVDYVPSETVTIDPQLLANLSFTMHSFHAVGQINHCKAELYNQNSELLDNMTVYFETLDTCFCYGYCGCTCGDNVTDCPPPPEYDEEDVLKQLDLKLGFVKDVADFIKSNLGKFVLVGWFIFVLILLGALKVVHMLLTGQIDYPMITDPVIMVSKYITKIFSRWLPKLCESGCDCCQRCCINSCGICISKLTGQKDYTAQARDTRKGWRRPRQCDGMCEGAKKARRVHRRQMRINKRNGKKIETVWFQKPYTCTCRVRDTMPCLEICKGLFFFVYCPLLPLWWIVEFAWEYTRKKWRRHKRKRRYREMKAAARARQKQTYLMLDKYTRGKVEKQIVDFDKELKTKKKKQLRKENKGFTPGASDLKKLEEECKQLLSSQSEESSDTTDVDEAEDIEELLNPGYPVYFNYAYVPPKQVPASLVNPGKNFSIKGKLIESKGMYVFELHTYTLQVKQMLGEKPRPLQPPTQLHPAHFKRQLDASMALKLITMTPLFTCLNTEPKQ